MKKVNLIGFLILFFAFGFSQEPEAVYEGDDDEYITYEESEQYEDEYLTETPQYTERRLDPKFKEKYNGKIYDYDRIVEEKKEEPIPPEPIAERESLPSFSFPTGIFEIIIYILIGAIVLLIAYLIFKNSEFEIFTNRKEKIKGVSTETDENLEDITLNNFQRLIEQAKSEGDYRKAVRYYYLWLLQKLSDKKHIKWHRDKTDNEYLTELSSHKIIDEFAKLLYLYDYVWFGKYPLSESDFQRGESYFKTTLNKI